MEPALEPRSQLGRSCAADLDTGANHKPKPNAKPNPSTKTKPNPSTNPKPNPSTNPNPNPNPDPDPNPTLTMAHTPTQGTPRYGSAVRARSRLGGMGGGMGGGHGGNVWAPVVHSGGGLNTRVHGVRLR